MDASALGGGTPQSIYRIHITAHKCHALRIAALEAGAPNEAVAASMAEAVVCGAGRGEETAVAQLGMPLSAEEAAAALERVSADLRLLALDGADEEELRPRLASLTPEAAEAFRWLAWREAWDAACDRAVSGTRPLLQAEGGESSDTTLPAVAALRSPARRQILEKARAAWSACRQGAASIPSAQLFEALALLAIAARAVARHTAACRVVPRSSVLAAEEWQGFQTVLAKIESLGVMEVSLLEIIKWLLWNAAWHAANTVAEHQDDNYAEDAEEEDNDEEVDEEVFGEDYPGVPVDGPLTDLSRFLMHGVELHQGSEASFWRGICVDQVDCARIAQLVTKAGFNAVRVTVPRPRDDQDEVSRVWSQDLSAALRSLSVSTGPRYIVLDLSRWSTRVGGMEALCGAVTRAATVATPFRRVVGVALPRLPLHNSAPVVTALRAGGLGSGRCAALLAFEGEVLTDYGEFTEAIHKALSQGEHGPLMLDGHIVFDMPRKPKVSSVPAFLEWASHAGRCDEHFPLHGCCIFDVEVPVRLGKMFTSSCSGGGGLVEELAARLEAASSELTHGWFARVESSSLQDCLERRWGWPDIEADRVLHPIVGEHTHTLIMLHGFMCEGGCYLALPEYFQRKEDPEKSKADSDDEEDEDDEAEATYVPFPGLKVVVPTAPLRNHVKSGLGEQRAWYEYLTDYKCEAEDKICQASLDETTRRVHAILDREAAHVGVGHVFLAGSSQGCCTALHVALTYPGSLGGVLACQGHPLYVTQVPADWAERGTPIRVCNGLADETIPWENWASGCYDKLRGVGDVRFQLDEGVDHCDDVAEGQWVRSFLREMLPS